MMLAKMMRFGFGTDNNSRYACYVDGKIIKNLRDKQVCLRFVNRRFFEEMVEIYFANVIFQQYCTE